MSWLLLWLRAGVASSLTVKGVGSVLFFGGKQNHVDGEEQQRQQQEREG